MRFFFVAVLVPSFLKKDSEFCRLFHFVLAGLGDCSYAGCFFCRAQAFLVQFKLVTQFVLCLYGFFIRCDREQKFVKLMLRVHDRHVAKHTVHDFYTDFHIELDGPGGIDIFVSTENGVQLSWCDAIITREIIQLFPTLLEEVLDCLRYVL